MVGLEPTGPLFLIGRRPHMAWLVARKGHSGSRLKAIALRLEVIASRLETITLRLEATALGLDANASRLEAIALRPEAIAIRLEDIPFGLEAIAIRWVAPQFTPNEPGVAVRMTCLLLVMVKGASS